MYPTRLGPISLPVRLQSGTIVACQLHLFAGRERYHALEFGQINGLQNALVRIESACTFAHLYGSILCDCEAQFINALEMLAKEQAGLLIYALDQHGRGIGIDHHIEVYQKEQTGYDTVEAHKSLGLPVDARRYDEVAAILNFFGLESIRLLTNNPSRVRELSASGCRVVRVPHEIALDIFNARELMVKKEKLGHALSFVSDVEWVENLRRWHLKTNVTVERAWGVLVVSDFRDELVRDSGKAESVERAVAQFASSDTSEALSIYLTHRAPGASTKSLDLLCLLPIAARTRVILAATQAQAVSPGKHLLRVPENLRELKFL